MRIFKQFAVNNECYQRNAHMTPRGVMVHSTGSNNPMLKRYVQPDDGRLGRNDNGNHFNVYRPGGRQVCVHAFVGKMADGAIATYQTLPWDMRGWHSGKGAKGSANDMGYIGFEICEDGLSDLAYFRAVYQEAVELTAYLCKTYKLNPKKDGVVICHSEGHKRGIASNHADIMHWFPKFGKTMDAFRADVAKEMESSAKETPDTCKEDGSVDMNKILASLTDEQAYYIQQKAERYIRNLPEPEWSQEEGHWKRATEAGLVDGTAPERPVKRDELAAILGRNGLLG